MAFIIGGTAGALIGGAAISGLAGLGGAAIQGGAANSAADKQAAAAAQANALQEQMYNQTRADQEPWRAAGATALSQLGDPSFQKTFGASDYQQDPGYAFRMAEGQKALERSAAARGGLQSGGTLKALDRYSQDYASNEYGKAYDRFNNDQTQRFNRLSSIAGLGQTANSQLGQAGQNYAGQYGNNLTGAANASGAAGIAGANALAGGLSSLGKGALEGYAASTGGQNWMGRNLSSLGQGGSYTDNNYTMPSFGSR